MPRHSKSPRINAPTLFPLGSEPFLAAINANLDEDTPRLVFADWLDENGDANSAAFIRKQIELARLPVWEPTRLRAECLDYSGAHGAERPKPQLPDGVTWADWPFRRGFPAAIRTHNLVKLAKYQKELEVVAPVEELEVFGYDYRGPLNIKPLTDSPLLSRIRSLTFSIATLNQKGLDLLLRSRRTAKLTELSVVSSDNPGGSFSQVFRSSLIHRLERLELSVPWDDSSDLLDAISAVHGPARLRGLMLMGNDNDPHPALLDQPDFYSSRLFENLVDLNLQSNHLTGVEIGLLLQAPFLERVESLDLHGTKLGAAAQPLLQSSRLRQLRLLNLAGNGLTAKITQALAESSHLANLRVLDLSSNAIGNAGATVIAKSPYLTGLLDLNLRESGVRDVGAKALADSPLADTLIRLNLSGEDAEISAKTKRQLQQRFGERVQV